MPLFNPSIGETPIAVIMKIFLFFINFFLSSDAAAALWLLQQQKNIVNS